MVLITSDLFAVGGDVSFYMRNGNEVWGQCDLKVTYGGEYATNQKLFGWEGAKEILSITNKFSGPRHFSVAF